MEPEEIRLRAEAIKRGEGRVREDLRFVRPLHTLGEEIRARSEKVHFGIPSLDRKLNGVRVGELTMVAGLPGHGKSLAVLTLVYNNPTLPILWVTPDESRAKVMGQLAAISLDLNYTEDMEPVLESRTHDDRPTHEALDMSDRITEVMRTEFPYFTVVGGERLGIPEIGVAMDEAAETTGAKPKLLVFDYLRQLQTPPRCDQPGWRSEAFKALGAKTDTGLVVINQVMKGIYREALQPHADLLSYEGERESYQIIWATRAAILDPEKYGGIGEERQPKVTLFVLKNKNGKLMLEGKECAIARSGLIEDWTPRHSEIRRGSGW